MKLLRDFSSKITEGWGGTFVRQPWTWEKPVNSFNQRTPNVSTSVLWQQVFWLWQWKPWVLLCASEGSEGVFGACQVMAGFVLRELQKVAILAQKK